MPLCFCVAAFFRLLPSLTCKPSSVVYGHLSGRIVADAFKRYSRRTSGEQPYATCAQSCTGRGLHGTPRLLCGLFLLHYPWSRLHRTLSGVLLCGARTFLIARSATRPYDQLGSLYIIQDCRLVCQAGIIRKYYFAAIRLCFDKKNIIIYL